MKINEKSSFLFGKSGSIGYKVDQSELAITDALNLAENIVIKAYAAGNNLRRWAGINELAYRISITSAVEKLTTLKIIKNYREKETILRDTLRMEDEISTRVHRYFSQINFLLAELRRFNPPLTTTQLSIFLEKILEDRRKTISKLEPFGDLVKKIVWLKTRTI